ncbi:hypothetical protein U1Q18_005931 [Sarracenia purpurea var. burkii]
MERSKQMESWKNSKSNKEGGDYEERSKEGRDIKNFEDYGKLTVSNLSKMGDPREGKELCKLTKINSDNKSYPDFQLKGSDLGGQIFQKARSKADHLPSKAQGLIPSISLGLANPIDNSPIVKSPMKRGPSTDPISCSEPAKGDLRHEQNKAARGEENHRASRAQKWKRRAREPKESSILTTGDGDGNKRKTEGKSWKEDSDDQEEAKKRQRLEMVQQGTKFCLETAAADTQPRRSP